MHRNIELFIQASTILKQLLELFPKHGVHGVITKVPFDTVITKHGKRTTYAHLIQCSRETWQVEICLTHDQGLTSPMITVEFNYSSADAGLFAWYDPLCVDQTTSARFKKPTDLALFENAYELLRLRRNHSSHPDFFEGFSTERFMKFMDALVIQTASQNSKAKSNRRSKARIGSYRSKDRIVHSSETGSLFDNPE